MEEILNAVMFQIENSGVMEKLSAGIVLTGGGALLKDLSQLVRYKTGMDVRIGYPCEHLAANTSPSLNHPMLSTAIGLLLKGHEYGSVNLAKEERKVFVKETNSIAEENSVVSETREDNNKQRSSIFDKIKNTFTEIFDDGNDTKM